jgi:hypothetical protein
VGDLWAIQDLWMNAGFEFSYLKILGNRDADDIIAAHRDNVTAEPLTTSVVPEVQDARAAKTVQSGAEPFRFPWD